MEEENINNIPFIVTLNDDFVPLILISDENFLLGTLTFSTTEVIDTPPNNANLMVNMNNEGWERVVYAFNDESKEGQIYNITLTRGIINKVKIKVRKNENEPYIESNEISIYAYKKPYIELISRTETEITIKWKIDKEVEQITFEVKLASGIIVNRYTVYPTTLEGEYTFNVLNPNKTYYIYGSFDKRGGNLLNRTNEKSNTLEVTTYDVPYLKSVTPKDFKIGETVSVELYNPLDRMVTIDVIAKESLETIGTASINGLNGTLTMNNELMYMCLPNSQSQACTFECVTSTEHLYRIEGSFSVNGTEKPQFEDFDCYEKDSYISTLTGNTRSEPTNVFVKNHSFIEANAGRYNPSIIYLGTTINNFSLNIGTKNDYLVPTNNQPIVLEERVTEAVDKVTMYATDKRGLSTGVEKNVTVLNYFDVIVSRCEIVRSDDGIGSNVILNAEGSFWNENFGVVHNELVVEYNYKLKNSNIIVTGETVIEPIIDGNSFAMNVALNGDLGIEGFSTDKVFDITVIFKDKITSIAEKETIQSVYPAIAITDDNNVAIGGKYNENIGGKMQVYGDVYNVNNNTANRYLPQNEITTLIENHNFIPKGTLISENTNGHNNQYLKLFSIDTKDSHYKTNHVYFILADVQSMSKYCNIFELSFYRGTDAQGITAIRLSEKMRSSPYENSPSLVKNLYAIIESAFVVSVYYKPKAINETPKLQILSYQKYRNEVLTIANPETYVNVLPSGTQQACSSYNNIECGMINFPEGTANTIRSITINFKKNFTKAPVVVATAQTQEPGQSFLGIGVRNITATSATIYIKRTDTYGTTINWIAMEES